MQRMFWGKKEHEHQKERKKRKRREKKNLTYQILKFIIKLKLLKHNATGQKRNKLMK